MKDTMHIWKIHSLSRNMFLPGLKNEICVMATSVCSRVVNPHGFSSWYRRLTTHGALWNIPSLKPSSWCTWTATCMSTCSEVSSLLNCWKWHNELFYYRLLTSLFGQDGSMGLWTETESRSINTQKTRPISNHLYCISLVKKGFMW